MSGYRDLMAWQKGIELVAEVYELTRGFPADEKWGLTGQIRRAAVSIPSNIAEGYARTHRGDYLHHLSIARGSLAEVETQLTIALRLNFTTEAAANAAWNLSQDVGKPPTQLVAALRQPPTPKP